LLNFEAEDRKPEMSQERHRTWWIFGGAGFIGQHFAHSVLSLYSEDHVVLLDIRDPNAIGWQAGLADFSSGPRLQFIQCDVRIPLKLLEPPLPDDVLLNFAAIHREPGHRPEEYFQTNLKGAENVCRLAVDSDCDEIIFTSSISVYGEHANEVDEDTTPNPKTAYGKSKLQAEQIHLDWSARTGGKLSIVRPGVVFGPGEGGNVSRLVKETLSRGRAIQLMPDLAKSGIYIEELLAMIHWLRDRSSASSEPFLINGVSKDLIHFNDYGRCLQALKKLERNPLNIPIGALAAVLKLASPLKYLVSTSSKFHPERLLKLTRPNAIRSIRLRQMGYPHEWTLERAMADWLNRGI